MSFTGKEGDLKLKYTTTRKIMLFWTLFIGLGAVVGATGMLTDPTGKAMGMDAMLPFFQKLPFADILFRDFVFSGIALLLVNGLTNLTAAYLIFRKKKSGDILGFVFGITLMLWICIQFYMFPFNVLSTAYFVFGFLQFATGYYSFVLHQQEQFSLDASDFRNIGTDKRKAIVYFSRKGYGKKLACEEADQSGACTFEIKTTEPTNGTGGFWWCGRFALHRWSMPIEEMNVEFSRFDEVTIVTPVWVFALSSPIRAFCKANAGKLKCVNLICIHFNRGRYENVKREAENLLKTKVNHFESRVCRFGKIV